MSEIERSTNPKLSGRFRRRRRSIASGILGPVEVIGFVAAFGMLLVVLFSYLYFLAPARSRVQGLTEERGRLQGQLKSSEDVIRQDQDTKAMVEGITNSLEDFETSRLVHRSQGRMVLYDELNELMRKNGLRNTSGPTYTALDPTGLKSERVTVRSASAKWQSVYPGIGVSVTVDGPYQNLRQFIRAIEASRQFVVINAVELERATESSSSAFVEEGTTSVQRPPTLVSLRLDMAIYFQREVESEPSSVNQP